MDVAYWSVQRLPKEHREYVKQDEKVWPIEADIQEVGGVSTRLARLAVQIRYRLINWGYLAAHCALPFLNWEWRQARERKERVLARFALPFPDEGISTRPATKGLIVQVKPEFLK